MKYLFVITGIGLGHATREDAIIKEILNKDKNAKIHIATFGTAYNYFKKKFSLTLLHGQQFTDTSLRINSFKVLKSNLNYPVHYFKNINILKNLIKRFNPDVVIVDAQPEGISAAKAMNKKSIFVFNLDLEHINYDKNFGLYTWFLIKSVKFCYKNADKVIIPVLTQMPKIEDKRYYVNPIIREHPARLADEYTLMKELGFEKRPILVTIGGSRFGMRLIKNIVQIAKHYDETFVIFGLNVKPISKNVICLPFKQNFLEYLKICKAIISLAGHSTLSEILFYKKPALIFPIDNYIEHYQNAQLIKYQVMLGNFDDISLVSLRNTLNEFFKKLENYERKIRENKLMVNGAFQAANIILQALAK